MCILNILPTENAIAQSEILVFSIRKLLKQTNIIQTTSENIESSKISNEWQS